MAYQRLKTDLRLVLCVSVAGAVGAIAWSGPLWRIGLTAMLPVLIFVQESRLRATTVAIAYFGAVSWPMIEAARNFQIAGPSVLWAAASALLAFPWCIAWSSNRSQVWWRCPFALLFAAIPPIGLIGWASPLVSAGVLFPGTGWFGLIVIAALPGLVLQPTLRLATITAAIMVSAATNHEFIEPARAAIVRRSRHQPRESDCAEAILTADDQLQTTALNSASAVTVLPEAVVNRWTEATATFWEPTITTLKATDRTALIGAGLPLPAPDEYRNALIPIGAEAPAPFIQRVPVPIGMWKPFGPKNGVPLHLLGPGTLTLQGHRAAVLICYEQLLVWPILCSAAEHPTLLIGVANEYWTKPTPIPSIQRACLHAWSRLFSLPLVTATNS
ncbi:MAG: hypothetical protein IPP47_33130 [Bryobacterales bacterium]|nr:hypothetical protein [Bryobacterales bacterium]